MALAGARTTATSCRMSAASVVAPSASLMPASRFVKRARSISTKICNEAGQHCSLSKRDSIAVRFQ